jgi:hypothetical protein
MKTGMSLNTYDIELDSDRCDPYNNADLTISLRLRLPTDQSRQWRPPEGTYHDYGDATEPARKIIKWTPGAWDQWKKNFVASAQKYWHGRFWLVNKLRGARIRGQRRPLPTQLSGARFILEGGDADKIVYNHKIDVVRLHKSEPWFGSHSTLYDNRDNR